MYLKKVVALVLGVTSFVALSYQDIKAQVEYEVLKNKWAYYTDLENSLYKVLANESFNLLDQRQKLISNITTADEFLAYQTKLKNTLNSLISGFPERTALNAKIVKTIDKDFYRMEHVVFESRPNFYVTSTLYLPIKLKSKNPAILFCSGHNVLGYRSDKYQNIILNLVKKGFIVYAYDPIGQGERLQYFDAKDNTSTVGSPTRQHSYPGVQLIITGSSMTKYMIWDGMRAIDYLFTRKEVDQSQIGIYGRSGGGTQTALISAFDNRIKAAAPENYITDYRHLILNAGPQDAEQNITGGLKNHIDQPDLLIASAPKPKLLILTTRDMFNINGALKTSSELSKDYKLLNQSSKFNITIDDTTHASTVKNRIAMYKFFQSNLGNLGDTSDFKMNMPGKEELQVSKTGQVGTTYQSQTVYELNKKEAEFKIATIKENWPKGNNNQKIDSIKSLIGYQDNDQKIIPVLTGIYDFPNYKLEKYFFKRNDHHIIPYLIYKPKQAAKKVMIYLNPTGKSNKEEIEKLIEQGFLVMSADLLGHGELGPGTFRGDSYLDGISLNLWFLSALNGKSILTYHAQDINLLVNVIKENTKVNNISAWAKGEYVPALIHASAFNKNINSIVLENSLMSYGSMVLNMNYNTKFVFGVVPNALNYYDLPQLFSLLTDRNIIILNPVSEMNKSINVDKNAYLKEIASYFTPKESGNLLIKSSNSVNEILNDFFKQNTKLTTLSAKAGWDNLSKIEARIVRPQFKAAVYNVLDFAIRGDSIRDNKASIQKLIDKISKSGGGQINFPAGVYFINGPVHLKNNIHLKLAEGAILSFSSNADRYLPMVKVRWEGTVCYNYSPLIYAKGAKNIAITGKGTINGNGADWSNTWRKKQQPAQELLRKMGSEGEVENNRVFGNVEGLFLRPTLIEFYESENILLEGVTIKNSPFWTVHPVFSKNITLRNLRILGQASNNDGIDPDSCEDVLIENCLIDTKDDAISIKAGRDQDAWKRLGSKNIIIRNNILKSGANAFCIGSEMSGGVEDVYFYKNELLKSHNAINFKCNLDRGGFVKNIYISDCKIDSISNNMIYFQMDYHGYRGNNFNTSFNRFFINALKADHISGSVFKVVGLALEPISDLLIENVSVNNSTVKFEFTNVKNTILNEVFLNGRKVLY